MQFLTGGAYDPDTGEFLTPSGQRRFYYASDNLEAAHYRGLTPADLVDVAVLNGLVAILMLAALLVAIWIVLRVVRGIMGIPLAGSRAGVATVAAVRAKDPSPACSWRWPPVSKVSPARKLGQPVIFLEGDSHQRVCFSWPKPGGFRDERMKQRKHSEP